MINSVLSYLLLVPLFLDLIWFIIRVKGDSDMAEKMDMKVETEEVEKNLNNYNHNRDDGFTESKVSLLVFKMSYLYELCNR